MSSWEPRERVANANAPTDDDDGKKRGCHLPSGRVLGAGVRETRCGEAGGGPPGTMGAMLWPCGTAIGEGPRGEREGWGEVVVGCGPLSLVVNVSDLTLVPVSHLTAAMRCAQLNGADGSSGRVRCRRRKLVMVQLLNMDVGSFFLPLGEARLGGVLNADRSQGRKFPCEGSQRRAVGSVAGIRIMCWFARRARQRRLVFSFGFLQSGSELQVCVVCPRKPENMARPLQQTRQVPSPPAVRLSALSVARRGWPWKGRPRASAPGSALGKRKK